MKTPIEFYNFTDEGFVDYTFLNLQDPPKFHPFQFEIFDYRWWAEFAHRNSYFAPIVGLIYVALIFGLQRWMRDKKPYNLKKELFYWNAGLGIFSIVAFIRIFPEISSQLLKPNGLFNSVCVRYPGSMPLAFWGFLFVLSKFLELGDTVFIVLRKKPLLFLQWYHHLMTMIVCWITGPFVEPICMYYIIMNYGVHSLMYPYFALKALDVNISRKISNVITALQLGQMLIGLFVNSYSTILYYNGTPCFRHPTSMKLYGIVYGSFTILFGNLFYKLVLQKNMLKKSD